MDQAAIGRICHLLDGIPLAIELAAPWIGLLTPKELLPRLDDPLGFSAIRRGGPHRQRTLRVTVDWSYQLLSEPERALFLRLAVFSGGFTVEPVEAICDAGDVLRSQVLELLLALSRQSLIHREKAGGQARHRLLDTLGQFAPEHLCEAGEEVHYRDRHLGYLPDLATHYRRQMRIRQGSDIRELRADRDNLLAAPTWARDRDPEEGSCVGGDPRL